MSGRQARNVLMYHGMDERCLSGALGVARQQCHPIGTHSKRQQSCTRASSVEGCTMRRDWQVGVYSLSAHQPASKSKVVVDSMGIFVYDLCGILYENRLTCRTQKKVYKGNFSFFFLCNYLMSVNYTDNQFSRDRRPSNLGPRYRNKTCIITRGQIST